MNIDDEATAQYFLARDTSKGVWGAARGMARIANNIVCLEYSDGYSKYSK